MTNKIQCMVGDQRNGPGECHHSWGAFKNHRLNQRVASDPRLISREDWIACVGEIDREALHSRACWGALDLSSTTDLTCLLLVFEPAVPGEPMDILVWFWLPGALIAEREADDKVQYSSWVREGFIEALLGRAIDKQAVVMRLAEIAGQYDLRGLAFDEWRFADIQKLLDDEGIELPLRKTRQGYKIDVAVRGCPRDSCSQSVDQAR
jgi:phage terminase large subunit-like protein